MVQKAGLRILQSFKDQNSRSFVELCKEAGYPTDLGGYYLRQLLRSNYLSKGERGEYLLTAKGRKYITSEHVSSDNAPRPHVLIVPKIENDLVVLERHQQPFLDRKEWPATAVTAGELRESAVERLLNERLAKSVQVSYVGVFRRLDTYDGELFDDKVFFIHTATLMNSPALKVINGVNTRIKMSELATTNNKSRSLLDIFNFTQENETYTERQYDLSYEDFDLNR